MLRYLLAGIALLFSAGSFADAAYPADPYALINQAATKTFSRLNQEQGHLQGNVALLRQIIREELMPYVDNRYAAFKVIGSEISKTSAPQRDRFVSAFTDYIVATYADALGKYDKQTIEVEKPKSWGDDKIVSVNVAVKEAGKPDINVIFKLRQNNRTGQWKAFDMVAEGISLLSAKQSELGGMIRDKGIDAASQMLEEHNSKPASTGKSS